LWRKSDIFPDTRNNTRWGYSEIEVDKFPELLQAIREMSKATTAEWRVEYNHRVFIVKGGIVVKTFPEGKEDATKEKN
jgi:predicted GTPase